MRARARSNGEACARPAAERNLRRASDAGCCNEDKASATNADVSHCVREREGVRKGWTVVDDWSDPTPIASGELYAIETFLREEIAALLGSLK